MLTITCSRALLALVAAAVFASACSGKPLVLQNATGTPQPNARTAGASSTPLIGSSTGKQPPFTPVNSAWKAYVATATALPPFRYPPDWQVADASADDVTLYPPTSDQSDPSPVIAIAFFAGAPFASFKPEAGTAATRPVTVAGATGWEFDSAPTLVPQVREVALPYQAGTLVLTAYEGPGVDLTPFAEALLSTLQLSH